MRRTSALLLPLKWLLAFTFLLNACSPVVQPAPVVSATPPLSMPAPTKTIAPTPTAAEIAAPAPALHVTVYYPNEASSVEAGQSIRFTLQVSDDRGNSLPEAQVQLQIFDSQAQQAGSLPVTMDRDGVYRSAPWAVPKGMPTGTWRITSHIQLDGAANESSSQFEVARSMQEEIEAKYGFWWDPPGLKGIGLHLYAERGDANNGMIRYGGQLPAIHILPSEFVDVQWRKGDFGLQDEAAVRRFLLEEIGDLSFTQIRSLGPFEQTRFKDWDAWKVGGRGQLKYEEVEWLVFYAPEVDKTYLIHSMLVYVSTGIDEPGEVRASFEINPAIDATGQAPVPLLHLLPAPVLTSPDLGASFTGKNEPILLEWTSAHPLGEDEYYEVIIDTNYGENNPKFYAATRETQFAMPTSLYDAPNCHVFNWQVVIKRQTGIGPDGQPRGEAISYSSLYWYVQWFTPPGETEPFPPVCPNQQT